jgi:hypothetical protein
LDEGEECYKKYMPKGLKEELGYLNKELDLK